MIEINKLSQGGYIDKLRNKEHFALVRYGDGEWIVILRGSGIVSAHLQDVDKGMQVEMIQDLITYAGASKVIFAMQRFGLSKFNKKIPKFLSRYSLQNIKWANADVFHDASRDGRLYPLVRQLSKMKIVIVGPGFLYNLKNKLFNYHILIPVSQKNCYPEKDDIKSKILDVHRRLRRDVVYAFSCGPLAESLILQLHEEMSENFLIDFGSLWDVFCGYRSRGYTKIDRYTDETFQRNLKGL